MVSKIILDIEDQWVYSGCMRDSHVVHSISSSEPGNHTRSSRIQRLLGNGGPFVFSATGFLARDFSACGLSHPRKGIPHQGSRAVESGSGLGIGDAKPKEVAREAGNDLRTGLDSWSRVPVLTLTMTQVNKIFY